MTERITREQAHDILMKYMKGERYIQHSYAVEGRTHSPTMKTPSAS